MILIAGPQEAFSWWRGVGDWVKLSATMVGWRRKISLKQSPKKWNFHQNINDSKFHIWSCFFWKYCFSFGHTSFWYSSTCFRGWRYQIFFFFLILKVSKTTKASEKVHSFYNTVLLKKPHSFFKPQLTWNWK